MAPLLAYPSWCSRDFSKGFKSGEFSDLSLQLIWFSSSQLFASWASWKKNFEFWRTEVNDRSEHPGRFCSSWSDWEGESREHPYRHFQKNIIIIITLIHNLWERAKLNWMQFHCFVLALTDQWPMQSFLPEWQDNLQGSVKFLIIWFICHIL